jgi:hypothetical protein
MSAFFSWFWVEDSGEDSCETTRIRLLVLPTKNTTLDTQMVISTMQDALDYVVGLTNDTSCTVTVNEVTNNQAKVFLFLTHDLKVKQKCSLFVTYLASSLSLQLEMKVLVAHFDEVTFKAKEGTAMVTATNPRNVLTYSK